MSDSCTMCNSFGGCASCADGYKLSLKTYSCTAVPTRSPTTTRTTSTRRPSPPSRRTTSRFTTSSPHLTGRPGSGSGNRDEEGAPVDASSGSSESLDLSGDDSNNSSGISDTAVIGIAVAGGVILLILVAAFALKRNKSSTTFPEVSTGVFGVTTHQNPVYDSVIPPDNGYLDLSP